MALQSERNVQYRVYVDPIDGATVREKSSTHAKAFESSEVIVDKIVVKTGGEVTGGATSKATLTEAQGLILLAPNGARWALAVSNTGQISAVQAT